MIGVSASLPTLANPLRLAIYCLAASIACLGGTMNLALVRTVCCMIDREQCQFLDQCVSVDT